MQLRLEAVSKSFSNFRLEPLTFSIEPGEFFCLLGPSGCGKTTVLRLIGGFEAVTQGKIWLGDNEVTTLPAYRRNIHTVFQRYALFPHLNVFDNVAFSLRIKKRDPKSIETSVSEILSLVEIEDLRSRPVRELSGGQSQRVALARALVGRPSVLLLDEPLSALDSGLRTRMREELKNLCRRIGSTFIMVTHDQEEALQLSDRMAVMEQGRCLQIGTPKAIYEDPVDCFVAKFIGPVNEIDCTIEENPDDLCLESALGTFHLKKNGQVLPKEVTLLLRPEKMRILRMKTPKENMIEGEVLDINYLGSRTEYTVRTMASPLRVFEPELERLKKRLLKPGDKIYLTWASEDAILLPRH